jgi:glutathione S-transferase
MSAGYDALPRKWAALLSTLRGAHCRSSGDSFSLADCAAAPFLFYAVWSHAIGERPVAHSQPPMRGLKPGVGGVEIARACFTPYGSQSGC